jgi:hypothetical protein
MPTNNIQLTTVTQQLKPTVVGGGSISGGVGLGNILPSTQPSQPSNTVNTTPNNQTIPQFGVNQKNQLIYPNDVVQLDIYNAVNQYLESNYNVTTYQLNGDVITLNVEQDLFDLNYLGGQYRVVYRFYKNLLGSGVGHKFKVHEVSGDGLEIRVIPEPSTQYGNESYLQNFIDGLFATPKSINLVNLFVHKDAQTSVQVFDYIQDIFTFPNSPYSIIFKFVAPIPTNINVGDLLWLSQQTSDPIEDVITIIPPKPKQVLKKIAGPDWNALTRGGAGIRTNYKNWNSLTGSALQTSFDIINKLLSGSFLEGIELNVDFRNFDNFVHFGTATHRLNNFKYKMGLLENYDAVVAQLSTNLSGLSNSAATSSFYFQGNLLDAKTKKAALIGSFDSYEKYLYYQSSSYVTNSYGEFYPTAWPKSTSTKPYVNYSVTSSQVEDWYDGIIISASLFDQNNGNALYKLIPEHVLTDANNEDYIELVNMVGHYFDLMFTYIKQMTLVFDRNQSITEGFSKELIYYISKNLGLDFDNGNSLDELWEYTLGTDSTGSYYSSYKISADDKVKETWKRILTNLPYLLKTKGTDRGLRALIDCFGIPRTILRIREYGGPEPEINTATDYVHDRFHYTTTVGYNGGTSGEVAQLISIPWETLAETGRFPMTVELRVKMAKNQTKKQRIMETVDNSGNTGWKVECFSNSSGNYLSLIVGSATASVSTSIYDGSFHSLTVMRGVEDDDPDITNQSYHLIVKRTNNEIDLLSPQVVTTHTASIFLNGAEGFETFNNFSFIAAGNLWIPGSGSFPANTSYSMDLFTGSVQEARYWTSYLQNSILDNHALAPTNFQGGNIFESNIFIGG